MNRVGWSIIVVWDKGLLVRNRVMGGHPVANQGVARMDKQNKQVMAGLVQLKFIQAATTVETLKQLPQQMNYLFKMHDFLAVQDSSISDIVGRSVCRSV